MATPYYAANGNGGPVIVQGQVIPSGPNYYNQQQQGAGNYYGKQQQQQYAPPPPQAPTQTPQYTASTYNHTSNVQAADQSRPEKQMGGCRDAIWAVLFYAHLGAMAYVTAVYAPQALNGAVDSYANNNGGGGGGRRMLLGISRFLEENNDGGQNYNGDEEVDLDIDPGQLIAILGVAGVLGCVFSSLSMGFMMKFAEILIKMALWFNIVIFAVMGLLSLALGLIQGALIGLLFSAISAWYAYSVWDRIPFAACNLVTAVSAVQANIGLAMYAYLSLILMFGWSIWWTIATVSTILVVSDCDENGECQNEVSGFLVFVFIVSFYWTIQVVANVVHVTTAGTVGTWWFSPMEANGCCSSAVRDSYVRSLTSSFGSICLGSLVVALIQAVREMVHSMRENGDGLVVCIVDCILGLIESLVEYFNKWAFVYVGLYGFSFMEAGSNVMTLFRTRGWTSIITDTMVDTVLNLVSLGVGALTALMTVLIGYMLAMGSTGTLGTAALLGFFIGAGMSATLFSVVSSAVNTVIVCYAEAPNEFQLNHPDLSENMRTAWRQAWPNDFSY